MTDLAIGIDLGTTNSCASYYKNGSVEILENCEGGRITPSCVFFLKKPATAPIVGHCAKKMADTLPVNGIYEIKRFVGKSFKEVQNKLHYFSFNVSDASNNPVVIIERQNEKIKKTPQEVCAFILKKIKNDVEAKLGHAVNNAVITVPAYFNTTQREVTLAAANQAGFTVLKLFNEPTAAALSFYFKTDLKKECFSLVYDLGGGTFDVSILKRSATNIDIICVDGDTNLGGKDFDNLIIDYVCDKLKKYNYNPKGDRRDMRRLQNKCEEAKIVLSAAEETTIVLDGFVPKHRVVSVELSRKQFEQRAQKMFEKTIDIVKRCLSNSNVAKDQIEDVILSGGSSRVPKIQEILSHFFNGKTLNKFLHLDECVAEGAALQAAMLSTNPSQKIQKLQMIDVVPLSIGISDWVDAMHFFIKKNSQIPTISTLTFHTSTDQQTKMSFDVYEGERSNIQKNRYLGHLVLTNITPAPPGQREIAVTMIINQNGILQIRASEELCNNTKELQINYTRGSRNDCEILDVVTDAQKNKDEDRRFDNFAASKDYLLTYCQAVKYNLRNLKLTEEYKEIFDFCGKIEETVSALNLDKEDILENLLEETETLYGSLVKLYNFEFMPDLI